MINNLLEALAVMLVTCCVIPILVLLSFIWFAKIVLAIDIPVDYSGIKGALSRKSHKNPPGYLKSTVTQYGIHPSFIFSDHRWPGCR